MIMRFLGKEVGTFSKQQQRIAEYLMQNRSKVSLLTVEELAKEIGVSMATISRFARAIGFANLKELRVTLHNDTVSRPSQKLKDRLDRLESSDLFAEILRVERENLEKTQERLNQNAFDRAVELLDSTTRVFVWADGPSIALFELLRFRLNRFGYAVTPITPTGPAMAEGLINIRAGDVVMVFSFLHEKREALHVVEFANDRRAHTVLCTDLLVAEIIDRVDVVLPIYRGAMSEFHSVTTPVSVVDALVLGIGRRRPAVRTEQLAELERIRMELPR